MNFKVYRAARSKKEEFKYKNKKTKYIFLQSISQVIANTPNEDLEQLVIDNFTEILRDSQLQEIHLFTMYSSWTKLFLKNRMIVYHKAHFIYDFEHIAEVFPMLESDIYNYLFEATIINKYRNNFDTPEDILQSMAYLEKYRGCFFPQVRKHVKEILYSTSESYGKFYNAIAILEYEFDIPMEEMEPIFEEIINKEVEFWSSKSSAAYFEPSYRLCSFFCSGDAYDAFMGELPFILQQHGLFLYSKLIKLVGPVYEIMDKEFDCFEFNCD